jgi:hypothetical protein
MSSPIFLSVSVTTSRACSDVSGSHYLVIRNRGPSDVELSFDGDIDSFLLKTDERERLGPADFKTICYVQVGEESTKTRLDLCVF